LDAVGETRPRCWRYDGVMAFDIQGLFDTIDPALWRRAVHKQTACTWGRLYSERGRKAPLPLADGTLGPRTKGPPPGGVRSPVLSPLFLHYAFEVWMTRTVPGIPWGRDADDGLVHWKTEPEAHALKVARAARLTECGLVLHPDNTQIVYGKDGSRKGRSPNTQFDCLGDTLRPRIVKHRNRNSVCVSCTPAVSSAALTAMRQTTRQRNFRNRTALSLDDIARYHNPVLRGW
jgi:retron-type reverse transcriptase